MNSISRAESRRSKRMIVDLPLVVRGDTQDKRPFQEKTFTITVNAHNGLIVLENSVALGQKIVLMNPNTWDEREARVVYIGSSHAGLAKVGVEFTRPAPEFWSISSPPGDLSIP